MKGFGGLGAWGMFIALIAICAFLSSLSEHRKTAKNLKADYVQTVEVLSMPEIVCDVTVRQQANALALCGYALTVASVASKAHSDTTQTTSTNRKEVSATVLLCHLYATKSNRDSLGLRRNRHTRRQYLI